MRRTSVCKLCKILHFFSVMVLFWGFNETLLRDAHNNYQILLSITAHFCRSFSVVNIPEPVMFSKWLDAIIVFFYIDNYIQNKTGYQTSVFHWCCPKWPDSEDLESEITDHEKLHSSRSFSLLHVFFDSSIFLMEKMCLYC